MIKNVINNLESLRFVWDQIEYRTFLNSENKDYVWNGFNVFSKDFLASQNLLLSAYWCPLSFVESTLCFDFVDNIGGCSVKYLYVNRKLN